MIKEGVVFTAFRGGYGWQFWLNCRWYFNWCKKLSTARRDAYRLRRHLVDKRRVRRVWLGEEDRRSGIL